MALYDNYKLSNSTQIPQYAGSTLAEMTKVGDVLQNRYEQAQAYDDYLSEQQKYAKVHDKDRPLFEQMTAGYRDRIGQRAKSGNYEDMVRATAQDARGFGRDYASFADNLKRRTDYQDDLEKNRKDMNLSADTFNKLLAASEYQTKGLTKDPKTGQVTGQFKGITPSKEIDFSAWTDSKLKDIIAKEHGWDATSIEGVAGQSDDGEEFYVNRGGKTVTVSAPRIKAILNQAMKLDPEFQGALKQKATLDTYDLADRAKPELVSDDGVRTKVQNLADQQGTSFGKAYQQYAQNSIMNDTISGVTNYGVLKREQHDVNSKLDIKGETEATGRKKADKETNTFGLPVTLPVMGNEYNEPTKIVDGIKTAYNNAHAIDEQYKEWAVKNKVQAGPNGRYTSIDPSGRTVDVTDRAMQFKLQRDQEMRQKEQLEKLDTQARRDADYTVTAGDRAAAAKARDKAYRDYTQGINPNLSPEVIQQQREQAGKDAYEDALVSANPRYQVYQQKLKDAAKAMTMSTIASRFTSKSDNESMEKLVNNMSTTDFKSNMLALEKTGSEQGGTQLTPDDYDKIKGKISFAGQVMDAKGEQAYIFTAEDPKTHERSQFQMKGIVSTKPVPKLVGADAKQFYSQQLLRGATSNPNKYSKVELSPGVSMEIRVPSSSDGKYSLTLGQGGTASEHLFDNEGDMTKAMSALMGIASKNKR